MNFLVNENQLFVSPSLAARIGVQEALLLQQLHYRLLKQGVEKEGQIWYCQTHHNWTKQLVFWNVPKIRRMFLKLEQFQIVVSSNKFNKFCTDRSKWYRIDYEKINELLSTEVHVADELSPQKHRSFENAKKNGDAARKQEIAIVISHLNKMANKQFSEHTKTNFRLVDSILNAGYTVDDCLLVIDEQVGCWLQDIQMQQYLRPMTLFRPANFESYLNNALTKKRQYEQIPKPVILDFEEGEQR
ncbi:conserved phage C-terminal domain-containing protein [Solibacillus silvestris]|uniref:conserved phage C-terminal domain-containing protein n=1 Tax=Solibacillus silvestris TaxID=76853 RepID=UPI003F804555